MIPNENEKAGSHVVNGPTTKKTWHQPVLRKLPIEATANSGKSGSMNATDGVGAPKTADSAGQRS